MKNNIPFQIKAKNKTREERIQWIIIKTQIVNIVSMYIPPDINIKKEMLHQITSELGSRTIIIGDLNGQNTAWGSTWTNQSGQAILEFLEESNMVILNDGSRTRLTNNPDTISIPDIAISSPVLASRINFKVIEDTANSDHFLIKIEIPSKDDAKSQEHTSNHKWNTRKADWARYKEELRQGFEASPVDTYEDLEGQINQVAERTIPIRTRKKSTMWKPIWWDGECDKAVQRRQQKVRELWNNFTEDKFLETKRTIAQTRRLLRKKKKQNFTDFCNSIDRKTTPKKCGI